MSAMCLQAPLWDAPPAEPTAARRPAAATYRAALEAMVRRFAFPCQPDGRASYQTCGRPALQQAFAVLGWAEPHPAPERECEAPGCHAWALSGTPTADGYKRLCSPHWHALRVVPPSEAPQ